MSARRALVIAAACLVAAVPADAHLVTTGLGPVYDGIGHLVLTPEDWIPVVAVALLAGLRGRASGRRALFLLPAAWLAGGLGGLATGHGLPAAPVPAVSFLVLGTLVAADLRMSPTAVAALAIAFGGVHGWQNGAAEAPSGGGALGLVGVAATIFIVVSLVAAAVVSIEKPWTRVAVRVLGSWIAASGLLLLGWAIRTVSS